MTLDRPALKTRQPTAAVPYPFLLVEGDEGAGKSWQAALLTRSERVGACYWLDLGEGAGDEYAAIPGTAYEVLDHDGTYAAVLEQILAVKNAARQAHADKAPPVVLIIDSGSAVWEGLKDWVSERAKNSPKNKAKLVEDPAAVLDISRNLWNDAGNRYRRLMTALLTFPGIVVMTARGKVVSATDPSTGQPYRDGRKDYSVESHKSLAHDATLWLRLSRSSKPYVIKARSVHAGIRPGDDPQHIDGHDDDLLDWLVFDVLRCDPHASHTRELHAFTGGDLTDEERATEDGQSVVPQEPRGQSDRVKGDASETTDWNARKPYDPAWVKAWEQQVGQAETTEQWQQAWRDLTAEVKAGALTDAQAADLKQLWQDAVREQQVTNEQRAAREKANA